MTDSSEFSPEQASDPGTSMQDMARIAAERPDLWASLAANPSLYPDLREWLGQVDDPAVKEALSASAQWAAERVPAGDESAEALAAEEAPTDDAPAAEVEDVKADGAEADSAQETPTAAMGTPPPPPSAPTAAMGTPPPPPRTPTTGSGTARARGSRGGRPPTFRCSRPPRPRALWNAASAVSGTIAVSPHAASRSPSGTGPPHAAARSAGTGHWLRRLPQQGLGRFWRVVVRPVGGRELMVGRGRPGGCAGGVAHGRGGLSRGGCGVSLRFCGFSGFVKMS